MKTFSVIMMSIMLMAFSVRAQWTSRPSGISSSLQSILFADINTGYAVGSNATILKTTNGGNNWFAESSGTNDWLFSVFFRDNYTVFTCGENGTILSSMTGVGVNDVYTERRVILFPNPASAKVRLSSIENLNDAKLIMFNTIGQKVKQIENL